VIHTRYVIDSVIVSFACKETEKIWLGQYGIRINKQWRLCFVWQNGDSYQVEIIDYHR
jgi:plasmid maintenance system killer protein